MKSIISACILMAAAFAGPTAMAQQNSWVQVEAHSTLREAENAARRFAGRVETVNGFRMHSGWYAIALGPFTDQSAFSTLSRLLGTGAIPRDSFVHDGSDYQRQFWPVGANALAAAPITAPDTPPASGGAATEASAPAAPLPPADETKTEARQSERTLDRPAREALQVALQYEGFYNSGIDGAFGPGTRRAMAEYQAAKGLDATGILTTKQRGVLLASYQQVIDSLGMRPVRDYDAGIEVTMPASMVKFSRYEAPFAHYDAANDSGVRVVLISQTGDQDTLFGLYDILQTLEIVPLDGPRERKNSEFFLTGTDGKIDSYTFAKLVDGAVKGFTLIWPAGDAKRHAMALAEMKASFTSLGESALADTAGLEAATQSIDLLSGLEIRQPDLARSGFFVSGDGMVLTTSEVVGNCQRITLDDTYEATVLASDDTLGVAILAPQKSLAPAGVAQFLTGEARLKSDVAVAGYSYEGRLGAPTLTFGTLSDLVGLKGERHLTRLALDHQTGDAGGPVLDSGGAVLGMLLTPGDDGAQKLPAGVSFATDAGALAEFLAEHGVTATATDAAPSMHPVDMSTLAADLVVLVSCWN